MSKERYDIADVRAMEKIIIYGAGNYGQYLCKNLTKKQIYGFVDEKAEKISEKILGFDVFTLKDIVKKAEQFTYVIAVVNAEEKKVITRRLRNIGINAGNIVIPLPDVHKAFYQDDLLFYEDYQLALIKRMVTNKSREIALNDFLNKNKFDRVCLLAPISITEYLLQFIHISEERLEMLDRETFLEFKGADVVLVGYVAEFNYYQGFFINKTDAPIINLMEVI